MKRIDTATGNKHTPTQEELEKAWWMLQEIGFSLNQGERIYHNEEYIKQLACEEILELRKVKGTLQRLLK